MFMAELKLKIGNYFNSGNNKKCIFRVKRSAGRVTARVTFVAISSYPSVLVGASDSSTSMASSVSPSLLVGGPSATSGLGINKGNQHLNQEPNHCKCRM